MKIPLIQGNQVLRFEHRLSLALSCLCSGAGQGDGCWRPDPPAFIGPYLAWRPERIIKGQCPTRKGWLQNLNES